MYIKAKKFGQELSRHILSKFIVYKSCGELFLFVPCITCTQGCHGQFLAGKATTVAATFYSAKSRQGLGLGGLASRGGPDYILMAGREL